MKDLLTKGNGAKAVTPATEKNGNIAKVELVKPGAEATKAEQKETLRKIMEPKSAEQRIKNAENFQKLAEKHTFLTQKSDELNAFMIGRDGLREKVIIMNDTEKAFEISNSLVIEEVLNLCSSKLDNLITESKEQILNFAI